MLATVTLQPVSKGAEGKYKILRSNIFSYDRRWIIRVVFFLGGGGVYLAC